MRAYLFTLIGALTLLVSCKQQENSITERNSEIDKNIIEEQYIENDSLVTQLKSDLYNIAFNPIFDGEDSPKTDSTNKLTTHINKIVVFEQSKIHFYRDGMTEEIISAKIKNSQFKFLDSIYIGIKKEEFEKRIKTKLKNNIIKICDVEHMSAFTFKFKNEILNTINYKGY